MSLLSVSPSGAQPFATQNIPQKQCASSQQIFRRTLAIVQQRSCELIRQRSLYAGKRTFIVRAGGEGKSVTLEVWGGGRLLKELQVNSQDDQFNRDTAANL